MGAEEIFGERIPPDMQMLWWYYESGQSEPLTDRHGDPVPEERVKDAFEARFGLRPPYQMVSEADGTVTYISVPDTQPINTKPESNANNEDKPAGPGRWTWTSKRSEGAGSECEDADTDWTHSDWEDSSDEDSNDFQPTTSYGTRPYQPNGNVGKGPNPSTRLAADNERARASSAHAPSTRDDGQGTSKRSAASLGESLSSPIVIDDDDASTLTSLTSYASRRTTLAMASPPPGDGSSHNSAGGESPLKRKNAESHSSSGSPTQRRKVSKAPSGKGKVCGHLILQNHLLMLVL